MDEPDETPFGLPADWTKQSDSESRKIRRQLLLVLVLAFCWVGVLFAIATLLPSVTTVAS